MRKDSTHTLHITNGTKGALFREDSVLNTIQDFVCVDRANLSQP